IPAKPSGQTGCASNQKFRATHKAHKHSAEIHESGWHKKDRCAQHHYQQGAFRKRYLSPDGAQQQILRVPSEIVKTRSLNLLSVPHWPITVPARSAKLSRNPVKTWLTFLLTLFCAVTLRAQPAPGPISDTSTNRSTSDQITEMRRALRQAISNAAAGTKTNLTLPTNTVSGVAGISTNAVNPTAAAALTNIVVGTAAATNTNAVPSAAAQVVTAAAPGETRP